jgi:hypothetical protein
MDDLLELVSSRYLKHLCLHQQLHPTVLHHGQISTNEYEINFLMVDPRCREDLRRYWRSRLPSQYLCSILQKPVTHHCHQGFDWCWLWSRRCRQRLDLRRMLGLRFGHSRYRSIQPELRLVKVVGLVRVGGWRNHRREEPSLVSATSRVHVFLQI